MTIGYDRPFSILPSGHRGSFDKGLFPWRSTLTDRRVAEMTRRQRAMCDAFGLAFYKKRPCDRAGMRVDVQLDSDFLRGTGTCAVVTCVPPGKAGQDDRSAARCCMTWVRAFEARRGT